METNYFWGSAASSLDPLLFLVHINEITERLESIIVIIETLLEIVDSPEESARVLSKK